jgi:hypothetical protein
VCRVVAVSLDNGGKTLLGDGEEGVARASGFDGIDSNVDRAVLFVSCAQEALYALTGEGLTVPFLNPTLMDKALANSRWTCDSVVLAPIAPQELRSARYWGEITSRNSPAAGIPISAISRSRFRATLRPRLMW